MIKAWPGFVQLSSVSVFLPRRHMLFASGCTKRCRFSKVKADRRQAQPAFGRQGGNMYSVFELIMLICFGISWPFSVYKSWKSKSTKGKSPVFLVVVWLGYVSGIVHKILYSRDLVILVYIFNLVMVGIDIGFYIINRRRELAQTAALPL
jgi:hypothetical protein